VEQGELAEERGLALADRAAAGGLDEELERAPGAAARRLRITELRTHFGLGAVQLREAERGLDPTQQLEHGRRAQAVEGPRDEWQRALGRLDGLQRLVWILCAQPERARPCLRQLAHDPKQVVVAVHAGSDSV
jgi:hypothetical protein